jgi:NADP-dependent 3-hydroxy acid dehydrogenase YdfG
LAVNELTDKEGLDVIFYLLDVTNKNHINTISNKIEQQSDRLDVLVNNAAIHYDPWEICYRCGSQYYRSSYGH